MPKKPAPGRPIGPGGKPGKTIAEIKREEEAERQRALAQAQSAPVGETAPEAPSQQAAVPTEGEQVVVGEVEVDVEAARARMEAQMRASLDVSLGLPPAAEGDEDQEEEALDSDFDEDYDDLDDEDDEEEDESPPNIIPLPSQGEELVIVPPPPPPPAQQPEEAAYTPSFVEERRMAQALAGIQPPTQPVSPPDDGRRSWLVYPYPDTKNVWWVLRWHVPPVQPVPPDAMIPLACERYGWRPNLNGTKIVMSLSAQDEDAVRATTLAALTEDPSGARALGALAERHEASYQARVGSPPIDRREYGHITESQGPEGPYWPKAQDWDSVPQVRLVGPWQTTTTYTASPAPRKERVSDTQLRSHLRDIIQLAGQLAGAVEELRRALDEGLDDGE